MGAAKHHHSHQDWYELRPNKISRETAKESALLARSNLPATPLQLQRRTLQRKLQSSIHSSFDFLSTPFKARSIPALIPFLFPIGGSWQVKTTEHRASYRSLTLWRCFFGIGIAKANKQLSHECEFCVCVSIAYIHP